MTKIKIFLIIIFCGLMLGGCSCRGAAINARTAEKACGEGKVKMVDNCSFECIGD